MVLLVMRRPRADGADEGQEQKKLGSQEHRKRDEHNASTPGYMSTSTVYKARTHLMRVHPRT